jgi:magnesium-transporting ATPase (P-type)
MARRNAIIRKLPAVETLGCTNIICTDKTGTLTENRMTVMAVATPETMFQQDDETSDDDRKLQFKEPGSSSLMRCLVLCNNADASAQIGDPTELALLVFAKKQGSLDPDLRTRFPRTHELPFAAERQLMVTMHTQSNGTALLCLKGAPEKVIAECATAINQDGTTKPLPVVLADLNLCARRLAASGLRVLACAEVQLLHSSPDAPQNRTSERVLSRLDINAASAAIEIEERKLPKAPYVLLGLIGLQDPPRPEARSAIARCRSAGVSVKMITGDNPETAMALAQRVGIVEEQEEPSTALLTGAEVAKLSPQELSTEAVNKSVFARISPEQKLRI